MKSFEILKKNRKYFSAILDGKYKCKILIDSNSESLEIRPHKLQVEDISVRSKYGTDLIFKLQASAEEQKNAGICTLRHHCFNKVLVHECRNLGGKWDSDESCWIFSSIVEDKVEELDYLYNSELVSVELKAKEDIYEYGEEIRFLGYALAKATGRDSGAVVSEGVSFIEGKPTSGGSMKNWTTKINENCVLRLKVPMLLLTDYDSEIWDIKTI